MAAVKIEKLTRDLTIRFNGESIRLPQNVQRSIDQYWQELIDKGKKYTRGEIFTVVKKDETQKVIDVWVARTDYAHYLFDQDTGGLGEHRIRVIHAAALVISSDKKIIFGKMGSHTARAGIFQLCGGGLDSNDLRDGTLDLDYSIAKELKEELGIDISDKKRIARLERAYLKEGGSTDKMIVIYRVELTETGDEFLQRYNDFTDNILQKGELPEFASLAVLTQDKRSFKEFFTKKRERCSEYLMPLFDLLLSE